MRTISTLLLSLISTFGLLSCASVNSSGIPEPHSTAAAAEPVDPAKLQTAVFAGGCFWGVEAVFEHTKGVAEARSGYAGGTAETANYDAIGTGKTGHAEAVEVRFDPEKISYQQLLEIFFKVAHNPTELDRQGPDVGPQYRSAIFYVNENQKAEAAGYLEKLAAAKVFSGPIVTQVVPLEKFYEAESYHQNYLVRNPKDPYIVYHDLPKLEELKKQFPTLYIKPQLTGAK